MIYILLPLYNEEKSVELLLPKIIKFAENRPLKDGYHIFACNDGSQDRTLEKLEAFQKVIPLTIINHRINRGLGETIRDLFEMAAESADDKDIIIRMDGDNTHEPGYIASLINRLEEGFDVVTTSRFAPGGGQEGLIMRRKIISLFANKLMRLFFPVKGLREYTSGFRCYRAAVIKKAINIFGNNFIQLKGLGFTCTLEKILKLKTLGARFSECPFVLQYGQKQGRSKMVTSITTFGYMISVILYYWPWGGWRSYYKALNKFKLR